MNAGGVPNTCKSSGKASTTNRMRQGGHPLGLKRTKNEARNALFGLFIYIMLEVEVHERRTAE